MKGLIQYGIGMINMAASMDVYKFSHIEPSVPDGQRGEGDLVDQSIPVARSGHRIVVTDSDLYSLGGYNPKYWDVENTEETYFPLFKELWQFNFVSRKWRKLNTTGHMPLELASHAAVRDNNKLLAYGGTGVPFGEASSNDLHVCGLTSHKWQHFKCTGQHPEKKYGHAMLLIGRYLYVCGGTTGFVYNMDVHRLSLDTLVWEKLSSDQESPSDPDGRYRHEMACFQHRLYIFGGGTAGEAYRFELIPTFCLTELAWENIPAVPDKRFGFPAPRRCHSCCQLNNDVYMCGGMDGVKILPDLWRFSLATSTWLKMSQDMVLPTYFHAADIAPNGCMYIFGGVTAIDNVRTSEIYRIWLKVPSLQEIAWNGLIGALPNTDNVDKQNLAELGVPAHFLDRIS
ncbi:kelch domain-containing protein 10-like [Haliotis cracherodii]|uniref:kelch domain-containing protein 10-like n=1 Tax=Haliotis cracherodii TaxID=6455 RepID=UPI0039E8AAC1